MSISNLFYFGKHNPIVGKRYAVPEALTSDFGWVVDMSEIETGRSHKVGMEKAKDLYENLLVHIHDSIAKLNANLGFAVVVKEHCVCLLYAKMIQV